MSGALWDNLDLMTDERMNQKTLYVGASAPETTYAGQLWFDSANNILYERNSDNNAWICKNVIVAVTFDDTSTTKTGTAETEVKYARFIKTVSIPFTTVLVLASLYTNNASGTAYFKVYVDSEVSERLTLSTTSTTETALEGSFSISDLDAGIHTFKIKIYNSNASYTTTHKILEVFIK